MWRAASSAEQEHLTALIAAGHTATRALPCIDVFSPCVTYNKHNTHQWFKERVYKLEETDYDAYRLRAGAVARRANGATKSPLVYCYQTSRPTYEDGEPALKKGPLVHHKLGLTSEQRRALLQEFL